MIDSGAVQPESEPITTIVPKPKHRVFRELTSGARLADFAWRWVQRLLVQSSPVSFNGWRLWVLRRFGADVHPTVKINPHVKIIHPWNLTLERGVVVMHDVILDCQAPLRIGASTRVSQLAHLCTATHEYERRDMRIIGQPISVGRDCWLAADVFVGSGVSIGDGAVLGARSSVFRDVPAEALVAGSPAKPLQRSEGEVGSATAMD